MYNVSYMQYKLGECRTTDIYEYWFSENAWRRADIALSEACINGLRQLCSDLEIDWTSRPEGYYWDKAVVAWKKKVVIPRIMEKINE